MSDVYVYQAYPTFPFQLIPENAQLFGGLPIFSSPSSTCELPSLHLLSSQYVDIEKSQESYGPLSNPFTGEFESKAISFEHEIAGFYAKLLSSSQRLDPDFEEILYENLWDLYIRN
jgi:hypothetical protein